MRNPNGYGGVVKLSGNRRKPYMVRITTECVFSEEKQDYYMKQKPIGYYATRKEAMQALAEYNKEPFNVDFASVTFGEVWEMVEPLEGVSKTRRQCYAAAFKKCSSIKDIPLRELRLNDLQEVVDDVLVGSQNDVKTIMHKIFNYGMKHDFIIKDYSQFVKVRKVEPKTEKTVFSSNAIEKLWQRSGSWAYDIVLMLCYSGMRKGELFDLKKEDVHLSERYLQIRQAKNETSVRTVPIHERMLPLYERFMSSPGEYLLTKSDGYRIEYRNYAARELKEVQEFIGEPRTLHEARHTFITRARECGIDLLVIQRIVGHKAKTLTENIYTHLTMEELIREINKIEY